MRTNASMERIKKSVLPIIAVSGPKSPAIKDRKRPFEPPVMSPVLSTKKVRHLRQRQRDHRKDDNIS